MNLVIVFPPIAKTVVMFGLLLWDNPFAHCEDVSLLRRFDWFSKELNG